MSDKQRWDRKYAGRRVEAQISADPLVVRYLLQMSGHGHALDVAAGAGDNACLLAQAGYQSFAIDISFEGLKLCRAKAHSNDLNVYAFVADLSKYPLPVSRFDIVVVMRFLDRARYPQIKNAVRPGGWMIYKTFNERHLQIRPDFPRAYVLDTGELRETFADWLEVATNDHPDNADTTSFWVGRRPGLAGKPVSDAI